MADTDRNILPRALLILRRADSSIRNQSRRVRRVNTLRRGSILRKDNILLRVNFRLRVSILRKGSIFRPKTDSIPLRVSLIRVTDIIREKG